MIDEQYLILHALSWLEMIIWTEGTWLALRSNRGEIEVSD